VFCPECWALLPPQRPPVRRRVFWPMVVAGLLVVVLSVWWLGQRLQRRGEAENPVALAHAGLPAVFTIEVRDRDDMPVSQGSGFLVDSTGRAVTAFHVLRGAHRAVARFSDGRMFGIVHVDAWDSSADLAVVELGREGPGGIRHPRAPRYPELRGRPKAQVGEPVLVVGSPEGFENTLSDGLVSGRRDTELGERIQLTAPISSGSSGGPVFDARGRVVGVVVSRWNEGQNLNFATPAAALTPLLAERARMPFASFGGSTREASLVWDPLAEELFVSGNEQFRRRRFLAALDRYRLALQADSTHSNAAYNAAMCLLNLKRDDEAEIYLRQYLRLPHDVDEFHEHAVKWLAQRDSSVITER
jgi:hypothetical protein